MQFLSGAKFNITIEEQHHLAAVLNVHHDLFSFDKDNSVYITDFNESENAIYIISVHKDAKINRIDKYPADVMANVAWIHLQNLKHPKDTQNLSHDIDVHRGFEINTSWDKGLKITPICLYCGK